MKFKLEVCLLAIAITIFAASTFLYVYQTGNISWASYPYRVYAVPFVGFGSALMAVASISYSKRSKNMLQ
jgi:hypothetical protein